MNTTMDRRVAARRRVVREAGARRRLRWLLGVLLVAGAAALVAWLLLQSSLLAVQRIVLSGNQQSDTAAVLDAHGVTVGAPTISISAAAVEEALLADPWVAHADVQVTWPGTVEVTVVEHVPAAWVTGTRGWLLASGTGAVLDVARRVPKEAPVVRLGEMAGSPGATLDDAATVGALEFLGRLPAELVEGAVVRGDAEHLEARIAGHLVDLGHPSDMAAKAASLATLLDGEVLPGARLSVVSPEWPAVLNPQAVVEGEVEDPSLPGTTG
jgi:cell division protein FtsQ